MLNESRDKNEDSECERKLRERDYGFLGGNHGGAASGFSSLSEDRMNTLFCLNQETLIVGGRGLNKYKLHCR